MSALRYGRHRAPRRRHLRRWLVGPGQPLKGIGLLSALIVLLVVPYMLYG